MVEDIVRTVMKYQKPEKWKKKISDIRKKEWSNRESETTLKRLEGLKKANKISRGNTGKKHSEESRKKISDAQKGRKISYLRDSDYWKKWKETRARNFSNSEYKKYWLSRVQNLEVKQRRTKNVMKSCGKKPNNLEITVIGLLNKWFPKEWKYCGDGEVVLGGKSPDFINANGKKKLIEIFGDYWHRGQNPLTRINHFRKFGFDTMVIWESEIKNPDEVKRKLQSWLEISQPLERGVTE